ncbi:chromosome partition protein Smc-like [Coccinella septempunctata]|uniref:chromosome partition protein Smc-like n=1 Tax=Coccinella septempunctata TaxID=41139 RepID=UPI001D0869C1|nr:chromosome partition protein Smc-like [Coccinella septempunctata]
MSFPRDNEPIHNKLHFIEIDDGTCCGQKSLNIVVKKDDEGILLIKLRDENNFLFNYTTVIHRNNFPIMKKEQSLDIDFDEFEKHLLEMLLLNLSKEMLMKCEVNSSRSKCRVIFYEKSKIKNLILLSIEMAITSQKDLFEEMETNMKTLQDTNRGLSKQIVDLSKKLTLKDNEITESRVYIGELERKFRQDMQSVNKVFFYCLRQCESLLTEKVSEVSGKIVKVISDIKIVKNENYSKSESSSRLLKRMEKMRLDNLDNLSLIDRLKMDCMNLEKVNKNLESEIFHMTKTNQENENKIKELENQIMEYIRDLENSAIAIAKKTEQYTELKEDMEQANQVIRNYNKHYDSKAQEVEELMEVIKSKDELIKEQIFQNNQLFKEFHEYKVKFNDEETERMMVELTQAQDKIKTLEKEKREMVKLNGLLTKKISSSTLFAEQRN